MEPNPKNTASGRLQALLLFERSQSKPNFTQIQLGVQEILAVRDGDDQAASAFAQLRHQLESRFSLGAIDDIVGLAPSPYD